MNKPFFLVGPTGSGKTELAVQLAEQIGGEIVSADAYQVYDGFRLLTAQPSAEQLGRVPHHLVGHVPVADGYNVAAFLRDAQLCISDIVARGKPALVVGGSGLYIKSLTHGLAELPAAQPTLRAELEEMSLPDLLARLQTLDPVSAARIDIHNKRRLVRALEVCLSTGTPFSALRQEWQTPTTANAVCGVVLMRDRNDLLGRIEQRVRCMFEEGVTEEVRAQAGPLSLTSERIIGVAEIRALLAGQLSEAACRERINVATRQYAKRQVTWFKRESCFLPVNLTEVAALSAQVALVEDVARSTWEPPDCDRPSPARSAFSETS